MGIRFDFFRAHGAEGFLAVKKMALQVKKATHLYTYFVNSSGPHFGMMQ
jgi:hypothetical protein